MNAFSINLYYAHFPFPFSASIPIIPAARLIIKLSAMNLTVNKVYYMLFQ